MCTNVGGGCCCHFKGVLAVERPVKGAEFQGLWLWLYGQIHLHSALSAEGNRLGLQIEVHVGLWCTSPFHTVANFILLPVVQGVHYCTGRVTSLLFSWL